VTISFTESAASTNYLEWALSTSYSGYESGSTSGTQTSFTISYLNPGSTFYYRIDAVPSDTCHYSSTIYASSFSTPAIPNHTVGSASLMGYVLGTNGAPLPGGWVFVYYLTEVGGGTWCSSQQLGSMTTTSSIGAYSIPSYISMSGHTCEALYWQGSAYSSNGVSYWAENWTLSSEPNSASGWNWQTFYVAPDPTTSTSQTNPSGGQNGVYTVLAFVHTTNAACQVTTGLSISTSVYAYVAGSGYTDTNTYATQSTFPATTPLTDQGKNVGVAWEAQESGVYDLSPSGGITLAQAYATGNLYGPYNEFYSGRDSVTSIPAIGSTSDGYAGPYGVPAGQQGLDQLQSSGNLMVQIGLQESVGVSVGEFVQASVSWDLSFGIQSTQTNYVGVNCYLGNTNAGSYQYFEVYAQMGSPGSSAGLGMVFHIWQCQSDPTQGACKAIDLP